MHDRTVGFDHMPDPVSLDKGDVLVFLAPLCHWGTGLALEDLRKCMAHAFGGIGLNIDEMKTQSNITVHACLPFEDPDEDDVETLARWAPFFTSAEWLAYIQTMSHVDELNFAGNRHCHTEPLSLHHFPAYPLPA